MTSAASRKDKNRQAAKIRSQRGAADAAEIGDIPRCLNPVQRESCRFDLERFLTIYFRHNGPTREWSPGHKRTLARIQEIILAGGRLAMSVFRGWAKTWSFERAAIWATAYGHRRYVVIYGADRRAAGENLAAIKAELFDNDLLYDDFPEIVYPIRCLEQKAQRQTQTQYGDLTGARWLGDKIVMARVLDADGEWAECSDAIIVTRGITGGTRGLKKRNQRPDCIFIDDPQTDESAKSQLGIRKRLEIITAGIANLVGHFGKGLSMMVLGSVIASGDLMEQLMAIPGWQAERIKLVDRFADAHETFWLGDYASVRNGFDRSDPLDQARAWREATRLYEAHRALADAGCIVAWEGCFEEGEISAVQHAYNKLIDLGKFSFASEMQSEPLKPDEQGFMCPAAVVVRKTNGFDRGTVPSSCTLLTAFCDVQNAYLPYAVLATEANFTCYVVEYGAFPRQSRPYYDLDTAWPTMTDYVCSDAIRPELRGQGIEPIIGAGLDLFLAELTAREWLKQDGTRIGLTQVLVDYGYLGPDVVAPAIQRLRQKSGTLLPVMPSKGQAESVTRAFLRFDRKRGDISGQFWGAKAPGVGELRLILIETNYWKSFLHQRLKAGLGSVGCCSLYHAAPSDHAMLADHLTSERPAFIVDKTGQREKIQWSEPPMAKNHLFDCLVGCCVGAAMRGAVLAGSEPPTKRAERKKFNLKSYGSV